MMGFDQNQLRGMQIFYPYMFEKTVAAIGSQHPFVHYCSSDAALSMLSNKEVWLRNVTWMNDASEIKHGKSCLTNACNSAEGQRLANFLDEKLPGFASKFGGVFNSWMGIFEDDTYIACVTEQLPDEDKIGRLSMWRAYGAGANPVAFILDSGPFLRPSDALRAYTSPVAYLNQERFDEQFARVSGGIIDNFDFLYDTFGESYIFNNLFAAFRYAVCCTKHPSFYEEREWRIVYQPAFEKSERIREHTRSLGGVPQRIFSIPLENVPEEGFYGATPTELIKGLLIGPGPSAAGLQREFIRVMRSVGFENAHEMVSVSDVPLRF
jgi:hypothetical protein